MARTKSHGTKFRARRIRLDRGGYDRDGVYWGGGPRVDPLFEVYEVGHDEGWYKKPGMSPVRGGNEVVRAPSSEAAVRMVKIETLRKRHAARVTSASERRLRYLGASDWMGGWEGEGAKKFWTAVRGAEKGKGKYAYLTARERMDILRKQVSRRRRKRIQSRRSR